MEVDGCKEAKESLETRQYIFVSESKSKQTEIKHDRDVVENHNFLYLNLKDVYHDHGCSSQQESN